MNFALCTNLFSFDVFKLFFSCKTKNIKPKTALEEVIDEINEFIENKEFDNEFLFCHILNKCIQISGSEYGFIGEMMYDDDKKQYYLNTYSITNIAWNHSSSQFFRKYIDNELRFYNIDNVIFGKPFYTRKPYIINNYDSTRNILPPGHPKIKRFLCVPCIIQDETVYIIGLCNKRTNYTKKDAKTVTHVMKLISLFFMGHLLRN